MRLGDEECAFAEASRLRKIYGKDSAAERHRHRYELNNHYREKLIAAGMLIAAVSVKDGLCEAVELPMHPWFIACQFHPEFTSTPRKGHPLFCSFIEAARSRRESAEGGGGGAGGVNLCGFDVGLNRPLFLIAGPCAIESREMAMESAGRLVEICARFNAPFIFKSSFDKANRSSADSPRGIGMEGGLKILADIKSEFGIAVTTDVHLPSQADEVAEVADILQIPAFLCRQTDLISACAKTGRAINIKKGQFAAPNDMNEIVKKARGGGRKKFCCASAAQVLDITILSPICGRL